MVSVVVPTHNRLHMLEESLLSLVHQTLAPEHYEIIVVDSRSTIRAESLVQDFVKKYPQHHFVYFYNEMNGGWPDTRHKGIDLAQYELIVSGDDDFIADPGYLQGAVDAFALDPKIGLVVGRLLPKYLAEPPCFVEELWTKCPGGRVLVDFTLLDLGDEVRDVAHQYVMAPTMAFRRSDYELTKGYAPDGFGKDFLYANGTGETFLTETFAALGVRIIYQPKMLAYHQIDERRFRPEYFRARSFFYGLGNSFTLTRKLGRPLTLFQLSKQMGRTILSLGKSFVLSRGVRRDFFFWKGFFYHQSCLRTYSFLLPYVLRESWKNFDYSSLPPISLNEYALW